MLFKSVLLSTLIAVQALAENLAHQEIVTVTKTTHISNPCLENYAKKLLPNNPTGLTTGIPIVIVYAPQQPDNQVKQSELHTTNTTVKSTTTTTNTRVICTSFHT